MMKKILSILAAILIPVNVCFSQSTVSCDTIELKSVQQIKDAEKCVLTASDYVLSSPMKLADQLVNDYTKFILKWMEKTPNYSFTLNEKIMVLCNEEENANLFGIYTACLAKAALENKKKPVTYAIKLLVNYIKNPENQVEKTPAINKLIDDFDAGKIEKYVN